MQIRTNRLVLAPMSMKYLHTTNAYATDPENTRYMVFLPNASIGETEDFIRNAEAEWQKDDPGFYEFAILRDGEHVGAVSLYKLEDGSAELGWILDKRHWGHGYALEAAQAMMDYAHSTWGFKRFIAQCDSENAASYRLMERLGMRRISCTGGRKNRSSDEERQELTYEIMW